MLRKPNIVDELLAVEMDGNRAPDLRRLCRDQRQKVMSVTAHTLRLRGERATATKAVEAMVKARKPNNAPMSVQEAAARRKIVEADEADGEIDKVTAEARELLRLWGVAS